jgi:predicted transcriptional regulator
LWDHPEGLTAAEIVELLEGRDLALTTVLTVLDRLRRKGMTSRVGQGRPYRHRATRAREDVAAALMVEALADSQDRSLALARFIDGISDTDAAVLRRALGSPALPADGQAVTGEGKPAR